MHVEREPFLLPECYVERQLARYDVGGVCTAMESVVCTNACNCCESGW